MRSTVRIYNPMHTSSSRTCMRHMVNLFLPLYRYRNMPSTKQTKSDDFYVFLYKGKKGSIVFMFPFFFLFKIGFFEEMLKRLEEVIILELGSSEMCTSELGNGDGGKRKRNEMMMGKCLVSLGGFYKRDIMMRESFFFLGRLILYVHSMIIYNHII